MSYIMPLITVIIPVYNVEKYLNRCIDSVVNQTYRNLEIILIDDGSSDNCPQMCDEWAKKDDRIFVVHKPNGGLSSARNAGIDKMQGEYLTFIDSDDMIHHQYIETLYSVLLENDSDISMGHIDRFFDNDFIDLNKSVEESVLNYSNREIQEQYFNLKVNIPRYVSACCKLYKKEVFDKVRYPLGRYYEDEFVTYKIFDSVKKITEICFPLYYYYDNFSGITRTTSLDKRFDEYDAQVERIEYYLLKDYKELYKNALIYYLNTAKWDLIKCNKNEEKCNNDRKQLFIKQYRKVFNLAKNADILNYINDYDFYVLAYPKNTFYFRIKRLIILIKNKIFCK